MLKTGVSTAHEYIYEPCKIKIYESIMGRSVEEPSLIAVEKSTQQIKAIGETAKQFFEREDIIVMSPMKNGMVARFQETVAIFKYLLPKIYTKKLKSPRALVCIPIGSTEIERKALEEALVMARVKKCEFTDQSIEQIIKENWKQEYELLIGITKEV